MNIQEILTTAGFIAGSLATDDKLLSHWDKGCLELVWEATSWAPTLQAFHAEARAGTDLAGVFDYEVSEVFGNWLRVCILAQPDGDFPPSAACLDCLRTVTLDFAARAYVGDRAPKAAYVLDLGQRLSDLSFVESP